ncbi:MAG: hypothetical protein ABJY83_06130 [Roseibium sp.]
MSTTKTIKVNGIDYAIVEDPIVSTCCPDVVTEMRIGDHMINISLAETVADGGNPPEARICARMRLNLVAAQSLRTILDGLIEQALKPAEAKKPN